MLKRLFACLFMVTVSTLAIAHDDLSRIKEAERIAAIPDALQQTIQKSQGLIRVRLEHLDGTVTYRWGSAFLVDKAAGFVVTSLHTLPGYKAVLEDPDAMTFQYGDPDATTQSLRAYVHAISTAYELAILRLEGTLPESMEEVVFANDRPAGESVYALIHRHDQPGEAPSRLPDGDVLPLQSRLARPPASTQDSVRASYLYLATPAAFFGEMVVDARGHVVGMANGSQQGQAVLTPARLIQDALADARLAEQRLLEQGGVTPSETHTIKQLAKVFEEIMVLYATQALERPHRLRDCAYEMFALRFSGACRDTFSSYLSPSRARQQAQALEGHWGGIGLELQLQGGRIEVVTPFHNSPAARSGVKPGDILRTVDGQEVGSVAEATRLLHGPPGTRVAFTVWRKSQQGELEERQFAVRRDIVQRPTVTARVVRNASQQPVGVVTIGRFRETTATQFRQAIDDLLAHDVGQVVVDVRNNPGGSLYAAVQMLAFFMRPEDTVLVLRERRTDYRLDAETLRAEYDIHEFGALRQLKLVVLINSGSASAAEVLAGTLQDWGYTVVGQASFGKGVVQSAVALSDASTLLLTTFEYFVGNHRVPIRGRGVLPNIEVAELDTPEDEQLARAIQALLAAETHAATLP